MFKVSFQREDGATRFQVFETLKSAEAWAAKKRSLGYQPEIQKMTAENYDPKWTRVAEWGGKRSGSGRPKVSYTKAVALQKLTEVIERAEIAKDDTLEETWDKLAKASLANFKARIATRQADIEAGAAEIRAFYNK